MNDTPKLLIVTSKTCGACHRFKASVLPPLLQNLEKEKIQVTHVDLPTFETGDLVNLAPSYPSTVQTYVRWFPTFLYFPPGSWEPQIFNGKVENGTAVYDKSSTDEYTVDGITAWTKKKITLQTTSKGVNSSGSKARYVLVRNGVPINPKGPRFVKRDH
ncbi:hypothetical protein [Cedratvirus kamchatka]|uniref:Thioredoxin-like protein n=1 Tax=Cedratvirus kamchatka TaxID=2716914 RepID=A0A6G8MZJ0_9VIRU|nr:hypothetical protein [Cedratvirus kamchatka]WIL04451.1 hypothetical protein Clen_521 [Cedratvirus lena]WIL04484.1 thioredoxin-like fold protein [Cedratvirus duvanny]